MNADGKTTTFFVSFGNNSEPENWAAAKLRNYVALPSRPLFKTRRRSRGAGCPLTAWSRRRAIDPGQALKFLWGVGEIWKLFPSETIDTNLFRSISSQSLT